MCEEREGGRERYGGDWGGKKRGGRGATLLPNEGSALVELRMDMEEGVTKSEY